MLMSSALTARADVPQNQEERQAIVRAVVARIAELEVKRIELLGTQQPTSPEIQRLDHDLVNLRWRWTDLSDPRYVRLPPTAELRAVAGDGQVYLEWEPVRGAKSYKVLYNYYGIPWTIAKEVTVPRLTITELTNNKAYTFGVAPVPKDDNMVQRDGGWKRIEVVPRAGLSLRAARSRVQSPVVSIMDSLPKVQSANAVMDHEAFTPWMSFEQYAALFQTRAEAGMYPMVVEGRASSAVSEYRAIFKQLPEYAGAWMTHHGRTKAEHEERTEKWKSEGYQQVWLQKFRDKDGVERYQTLWMRIR